MKIYKLTNKAPFAIIPKVVTKDRQWKECTCYQCRSSMEFYLKISGEKMLSEYPPSIRGMMMMKSIRET